MKTDEVRGPGAGSTRPNVKPAAPGFDEALRAAGVEHPTKPGKPGPQRFDPVPPPPPPPPPPFQDPGPLDGG